MEHVNRPAEHKTGTRFLLLYAVLVCGAFIGAPAHSDTSGTPSSIPAAGDSVKGGDLIFWSVDKTITLSDPAAPASTAESAAANPADTVAAALAISNAALAQVNSPGPPAPGAAADVVAKYKAVYSAYQSAQTQLAAATKANAEKAAPASHSGTIEATNNYLTSARKSLESAEAAKSAAKPGDAQVEAARAQADALVQASLDAMQTVVASSASRNALPNSAPDNVICFPHRMIFDVTSVVAASTAPVATGQNGSPSATTPSRGAATVSNTQLVSGHFPSDPGIFHWLNNNRKLAAMTATLPDKTSPSPCGATASAIAKPDKTYDFTADQLSKQDFYRQGFTWGGLVIPYKFYFKDKSFKSNSSVVGYVGYEGWLPGVSLAFIAAAGAGTTQSPSTTTGTPATATSTSTTVTYTAALGIIATFANVMKAGLMFGRDYQGNASAFAYENKTWMALSIGAGF